MSGFLIDTNALSEYNRPGGPDAGVKRWLETTDRQSQHVSVITLAEIQKGIELLAEGKRQRLWPASARWPGPWRWGSHPERRRTPSSSWPRRWPDHCGRRWPDPGPRVPARCRH